MAEAPRDEFDHCASGEHLADHRRAVEDRPLLVTEAIEASAHERLDRRRDRGDVALRSIRNVGRRDPYEAVVPEHLEHLHDEQRIPASDLGDPLLQPTDQILAWRSSSIRSADSSW